MLATNPPLSAEGLWFVKMFAPWLDPGFRDKAGPGELRWVVTDAEGRDEWVSGPDDVRVVNGQMVKPTSRTFIPAQARATTPTWFAPTTRRRSTRCPSRSARCCWAGSRPQFKDQDSQVMPDGLGEGRDGAVEAGRLEGSSR